MEKNANLPSRSNNPDAFTVDPRAYGIRGVVQLGRCSVRNTRRSAFGPHAHECFQLTICTGGSMTFTGDGDVRWPLLPGQLLVLPSGTVHKLVSNTRGNTRHWLFLPKSFGEVPVIDGLPRSQSDWLVRRIRGLSAGVYGLPDEVVPLPEKMIRVHDAARTPLSERRLRFRAMMLQLLLGISDARRLASAPESAIRSVMSAMAKSPGQSYRLESIAASVNLSPTSVLGLFRRETGKTPHQFLMECRLRRAAELLVGTDMKVTDIAYSLGFASSQHFAACFRRETGNTPRQWRAENIRKP